MRKLLLIPIFLILAIGLSAGATLANTAANTEIINNATLTFSGGSASATVTVTVALVPSQPNLVITDATGAYTAPNTPALTNSLIITSTANGPADYTTASTAPNQTNNNDTGAVSGDTTVTIGASVTTGTSGTTYVTVPAGGASGNNAEVNGIAVNDTIVFSVAATTYTRQVTSTTDNGDGTFQLNWSGAIPAGPAAGVQIGEQQTINLSVTPGTVDVPGTDITVEITSDVSTAGVADVSVTNINPNTWTTPSPNVNMTKYVRNLSVPGSNPGPGSGTIFTIDGNTLEYFTSGVTGAPGDVLEYVIRANNTSAATALTNSAISDLVPEAFVDFLLSGVYTSGDVFYIDPAGATSSFPAGAIGVNQASFVSGNNPNLIVNVGNGASNVSTGAIPATTGVTVAYQVSIK